MNAKGILIPIGGNEDKGDNLGERYHLEYIEEGILSRVVRESGGFSSNIAVLTTASSIPEKVANSYRLAFGRLGCKNIHFINILKREDAGSQHQLKQLQEANCIMFSGGNQSKIIRKIRGTAFHELLLDRFKNDRIVVAGTSAGAMCMSEEMITGGSSKESLVKGAVKMKKGLGLISNLIIDSHFIQRGRFGRLAEAVARHTHILGIGLAEDTGLVIKNCDTFEIIGSGMVILFDPRKLKHNNQNDLAPGTPMSLVNLKTHVLTSGDCFNITKRKVKVLPSDAPFIKV